jgi:atypical dual specificity phosphatase
VSLPQDSLQAGGDAQPRPFEHCYWLLPGRVLAGEHPGARGSAALMAQRLRTLQACGVGCFIDLTSTATMRAALDAIGTALAAGEGVYLHCRAGIGRTGTAAGCWLIEQGLDPTQALALLQRKYQAAAQSHSGRETPETEAQRAFVMAWQR